MSTLELYTKGTKVWIPDPINVWKCAEITEDFKGKSLQVEFEDGHKENIPIGSPDKLPPLRNPEILIGENDLTSLSYLHEPAVLYNLQVRFCNQNAIYTYCGIVLVAINPYEELPIYDMDTILAYRGQSMGDLDPHIFAVAEEAYTQMERENQNQSIIVSGESGAGKTMSAKYGMRYFAAVGGSSCQTHVEKKVLASNPIMEAIGNAKTTRNDNSSRFGKYIELDFNNKYNIMGANMRTYLLEKSRVVFQATDERNYHIFYQLCASADLEEYHHLYLGDHEQFHYTNQGQSPDIPGVDDAQYFQDTLNALTLLGFSDGQQMTMLSILAAILHLGNVVLVPAEDESCMVKPGNEHLVILSKLLGIDCELMKTWLCNKKFQSMREVIVKPMTVVQAVFARDALAKHIYAQLFNWIVTQINKSLASMDKIYRFIGVLDIYGFETFEINSFEQFCINYANEKLQQQFNQHVFKLEQEEYVREQIEWKLIDFYDNQPCIDLIESRLGILDLLDEECKMPKGTDVTWCNKLYEQCKKFKHFEKPRLSNSAFIIHHFADNVKYESVGFLEKNRDTIMEEQINILKGSQIELVAELFEEEKQEQKLKPVAQVKSAAPPKQSSQKQHKKTVGSQFRDSLVLLMSTLNSTTPHYVRCIKPNDDKASFSFDHCRAVQQLRACGVLETVRISAAGFPSRWTYQDFLNRYRVLSKSKGIKRADLKASCQSILENVIKDEDKFQFGKTKIFFRAGQVAYLEKLRADKLRACARMVQKNIKGWLQRKKYLTLRRGTLIFQCHARGFLARKLAEFLRRTKAAITIQKHIRGFVCNRKYQRIRNSVLQLQSHARGKWARVRYETMRKNAAATVIQKHIRGFLSRKQQEKRKRQIILAQSCVRRYFARKEFKKLKVEARSVEHMKKLNKGLENKIISLQQKIEELLKDNRQLRSKEEDSKQLHLQIDQARNLETTLKQSNVRITEMEEQTHSLRMQLEHLQIEKQDLITEKDILRKEKEEFAVQLNDENYKLKEDLNRMNELIKANEKGFDELLKKKLEEEKKLMQEEFNAEKTAYQKMVKENARLEQRCDNLQMELGMMRGSGIGHKRTPSDISLISIKSDVTELARDDASDTMDEDVGYGSVRVKEKDIPHLKLDDISWDQVSASKEGSPAEEAKDVKPMMGQIGDVTLVLKLQQRLKEVEAEKSRLENKVEDLENKEDSPRDEEKRAQDSIRLHELEMENVKLKEDLKRLRKSIADEPANQVIELTDQFEALQDELDRRREECIQLRSVLANQTVDVKSITELAYGSKNDLNEDGELLMAFETQKKLIRQLEGELQAEKIKSQGAEKELRTEIKRLHDDNDRQQKLISQNLKKTPQAQTEAILQHEINRLTEENVDLREKCDNLFEQVKKLKKQLKLYAKKIKEMGGSNIKKAAVISPHGTEHNLEIVEVPKEHENMPAVKHKEVEYMGMFEYRKEDEPVIIRTLIMDLKPKVAITMLPGLPAYILIMCVRHTDHINNDEKVRSLLNNTMQSVKRVIKKRHEDIEYMVLWLANTCRLLHNLKQYSGDKSFQLENTPKQNEQCLRNFDLSEYRQVLSDLAVWIYQGVIKIMEEAVQSLIVPAVLEHEAIPGISGNKPSFMRGRSSSVAREIDSPVDPQRAMDTLLRELNLFYKILNIHGVDPELITQVFKQLFYFICAGALNNLLLRKDMCHWSKGMQIRYNLSHLEQWCRDQKVQHLDITKTLEPVVQASQLLQARKTDEDVQSICTMCDKLTTSQIIKILNLYTPADEFEERVPVSFIRKIQQCLAERDKAILEQSPPVTTSTLLMDSKYAFPVRFPFNPSSVCLEDIAIAEALNLHNLLKKV